MNRIVESLYGTPETNIICVNDTGCCFKVKR